MIQSPRETAVAHTSTPEPAAVRGAVFAALLLGAELTLPGIIFTLWSAQSNMDVGSAGQGMLAFGAGIVVAYAVLSRMLRQDALVDFAVVMSGLCASLSLAALSMTYSPAGVLPSAVGMGIATGLLIGTQPLLQVSVMARAKTAAGLLGFAWAWGALAVGLFVWIFFRVLTLSSMMLWLAALFASAALLSWIMNPPRRVAPDVVASEWEILLTPGGLLLTLVVGLFGAAHGTPAGLLPIYVGGKLGSGLHLGVAVGIVYWLTIVTALLAGRRFAGLEERSTRMLGAAFGCGIGCTFLLRATEPSGIVAGTVVFGTGMGVLLSLLLRWIGRQLDPRRSSALTFLLAVFVVAGSVACWAASRLTAVIGIEAVVWTAGASVALGAAVLVVLLVETRFAEARPAAGPDTL